MAINMRQEKMNPRRKKHPTVCAEKTSLYEVSVWTEIKKKSNYSYTRFICAEYISDEKHYSFDWLSVCSIHTNTGVTAVLLFWC